MAPRQQLHDRFKALVENVYFQPPATLTMQYPCIVYARSGSDVDHADNEAYRLLKQYQVTVIDRNPDSNLSDQVEWMQYCSVDQFFVVDNLNHWVFTLFF